MGSIKKLPSKWRRLHNNIAAASDTVEIYNQ